MHVPHEQEFIIVDESDDSFSEAFSIYASRAGALPRRVRMAEFSREVNLEHEFGTAKVGPRVPMLLRPLRSVGSAAEEETRFCWNEQFSALWSAAALSQGPVVNRPNEWGWSSRAAFSAALVQHRLGVVCAPEFFWHMLPPDEMSRMFHQDLTTWQTVESPAGLNYVRSRLLPECRGWDQVIVVGSSAFRVTTADLGDWRIEEESVAVVRSMGLEFATVSWAILVTNGPGILARVNPFPTLAECSPVWNDVCDSLLIRLLT